MSQTDDFTNEVVGCPACVESVIDSDVGWDNHRCEPAAGGSVLIQASDTNEASADAAAQVLPVLDRPLEWLAEECSAWADTLGLGNWTIQMGAHFKSDTEDAYVLKERREQFATIFINPKASSTQARRLIVHELLHLMLDGIEFIAINNRSVTTMDLFEVELERVINTLTESLTGVAWEPINPVVRKNHEFED